MNPYMIDQAVIELMALLGTLGALGGAYFWLSRGRQADDLACFGWHCVARKVGGK